MSNSSLVNVKIPAYSGNYTVGRSGRRIEAITIHHMAGVLSAEQCGNIFQRVGRCGSSHYGIGSDGRIGQYVDEANTAWTNSNWDSNCKSVTIETSNSQTGGKWPVSDVVLNSLIKLVADIAKRNNLGKLVKGKNLTWHRMFTNTSCPGDYLLSKMDYIITEANKIIDNTSQVNPPSSSTTYLVKINTSDLNVRANPGTDSKINTVVHKGEVYTIVEERMVGNTKWGKLKSSAGWISLGYTIKVNGNSTPSTVSFSKGQRVTLKTSANKYCTGQTIPNWVKGKTYTIMEVGGKTHPDGVLLKEIMSWVYKSDVQ